MEKKAPVLTVFIGGNHEASNYLRQMYFGGWAAPNIYFLGQSAVIDVEVGDMRVTIGGLSGIEGKYDYNKGYFEQEPYEGGEVKSIYHYRSFDIHKFLLYTKISKKAPEFFMSHEWPQMVTEKAHPK